MEKLQTKSGIIISLQAETAIQVTPNDSTTFNPSNLYIGTGGTVKIVDALGNTSTFTNIPDGSILPVLVSKIFATDTTASGFILLN